MLNNKKGQFGPDFIIAIVVVLIIGLGGVVFMQLFIGGLSMQGLVQILDTESDQKCFGILQAMVADEYITTGEDVAGRPYFENLAAQYSKETGDGSTKSVRFEQSMKLFNDSKSFIDFNPGGISEMYYFLSSRRNARDLRLEIDEKIGGRKYSSCSYPVLGIYEPGLAELYIIE